MAGASFSHFTICGNFVTALNVRFKGRDCRAGSADLRVAAEADDFYTYPDVVVVCGEPRLLPGHDTLLNPKLIVEVLSPSTEGYDRGQKFALYQGIDSLTDYILVSQDKARVEHFSKVDSGHWNLSIFPDLEATLTIPSIGCEIPLSEIYERVELGPPPPLREETPVDESRVL